MGPLLIKFRRKAFSLRPVDAHVAGPASPRALKKVLGTFDLLMLGVGSIVGSGVFVLTGEVAKKYAGPGVVVAYMLASLAALFSALCYAEFGADIPVAGTAFNYIYVVYGEFMAWIAAVNLIMEYILTAGSVSKGFPGYLATMIGLRSDSFLITFGPDSIVVIDILGFLLIMLLTVLLCTGVKESATFNNLITLMNILTMLIVLGMAVVLFNPDNLKPFIPPEMGMSGVYHAAGIVFFSYIGFDGVATVAEEVKNAKSSLPIGIVGSILICAVLYVLMAFAIVGMVSYKEIDVNAAFSAAFQTFGYPWIAKLVSFGALTGIVTSLLLALLGQSRIFMVLGRERFLPEWIAEVHPRRQTPINATLVTFVLSSIPALLLDIEVLASMVSVGTLFVLCLVCSAVLWRSYHNPSIPKSAMISGIFLAVIFLASVGEGLASDAPGLGWLQIVFLVAWLLATIGLHHQPVVYISPRFNVPFKPYVPSLGMLFTVHLMCSLGWNSYIRFGLWQVVGIIFYLSYTMHRTHDYSRIRLPISEEDQEAIDKEEMPVITSQEAPTRAAKVN